MQYPVDKQRLLELSLVGEAEFTSVCRSMLVSRDRGKREFLIFAFLFLALMVVHVMPFSAYRGVAGASVPVVSSSSLAV